MADEIAPRASTGEAVSRGESRTSYEDRDRVVEVLRVSAGDGRLSAEELDERVEAALTARTYNELAALVGDLPERNPQQQRQGQRGSGRSRSGHAEDRCGRTASSQQPPGASAQGAAPNVLAVADAAAPASRTSVRPDLTGPT